MVLINHSPRNLINFGDKSFPALNFGVYICTNATLKDILLFLGTYTDFKLISWRALLSSGWVFSQFKDGVVGLGKIRTVSSFHSLACAWRKRKMVREKRQFFLSAFFL